MEHRAEHETWLRELLLGERSESDPQVAQLLAECDECQSLHRELHELDDSLKEMAREDRATREESMGSIEREDRVQARNELGAIMRQAPGGADEGRAARAPESTASMTGTRWPNWSRFALAAAGLLLLVLGLRTTMDSRPDDVPRLLGGFGAIECTPQGESLEDFRTLRFSYEGHGPGISYRIVVESEGQEVLQSPRLDQQSWTPSELEWSRLPKEFIWEVTAYDAMNEVLEFGRGSARREH